MSQAIQDILPALYQKCLPDFFKQPLPEEDKATCSNCAMWCSDATPQDEVEKRVFFKPETKCCTFYPYLPNYLVGGVLLDENLPEGQRRIREKIQSRIGVRPQWLRPSKHYQVLYRHQNSKKIFGRTTLFRCPYYEKEQGNCTIWSHREAVCSTFYCQHSAGKDAHDFWAKLNLFLARVEAMLSYRAVELTSGSLVKQFETVKFYEEAFTIEEVEQKPPKAEVYKQLWKQWEGREEAFYIECYYAIQYYRWSDLIRFSQRGHTRFELGYEELVAAYQKLMQLELPETLRFNPDTVVVPIGEEDIFLVGYNTFDPIRLPKGSLELLQGFQGEKTVQQHLETLSPQQKTLLNEQQLLELYKARVLIQTT